MFFKKEIEKKILKCLQKKAFVFFCLGILNSVAMNCRVATI